MNPLADAIEAPRLLPSLSDEDDPGYWVNEITPAEAHIKKHHIPIAQMVEQFASKWYRDDLTAAPTPKNYVFAYVTRILAQLAYSAPMPNVEANWGKAHGQYAEWMEACGRRWGTCYPAAGEFRRWVRDAAFAFGVMKRGLEKVDGKMRPYLTHIPMDSWLCDPRKNDSLEQCLFQAHKYDMYIDELQYMRGVDPAAIREITMTYESAGESGGIGVKGGQTGERKVARVYDLWLQRTGRVGTLLSCGQSDPKAVWLRPPRPWWGDKRGPFCVLGFKSVPGSPVPCSDLQPVMQQIEATNAHMRAAAVEADSYKTGVGVDSSAPEAAKAIEQGEQNGIWIIPGLARGVIQPIVLGSAHPQRMEHIERMADDIEKALAMGAAQEGISNNDTATANSIADQNTKTRIEDMRAILNNAAADAYAGVMYYFFYDDQVTQRVSVSQQTTDPRTGMPKMQEVEGMVRGGVDGGWYEGEYFPPLVDVTWPDDFTVTIDPDSTSHTSDAQRIQTNMLLFDIQERAWNMLATMQGADVEWTVNKIGEAMNIRDLFKQLFTAQMVAMAQAGNPMPPVQIPQGASAAMGPGIAGMGRFGGAVLPPGAMGGMQSRGGPSGPASSPAGARTFQQTAVSPPAPRPYAMSAG